MKMSDRRAAAPSFGRRRSGGPGGHGPPTGEKPKDTRAAGKRLLSFFGKQKGLLFISIVLLISAAGLNAAAPTILGNAITNNLERDLNLPLFFRQILLLVGIYIGAFVTNTGGSVIVNIISNRIIFRLRKHAFNHVQRLSIGYFDRIGIGDVISRLTNDIEMVYNFLSNGFISTLNAFFTFTGIFIAMFLLNAAMAGVLLLIIPVLLIIVIKIGKIVKKNAVENQKQVGALAAAIEESVSGIKVIQSFHRENEQAEEFDKTNEAARNAGITMESSAFMMMPLMQLIGGLAVVLVIGFGGSMTVIRPDIFSIGLVTAFIVYSRRIMEPFRQVANVYNMFNSALAGAERIFEIFDSREEIPLPKQPAAADEVEGVLEFRGVGFSYMAGKPVLRDISFEARPGQMIAIVGPTGAGKTTIINLLSRFYDVDNGEILIDGTNVQDYDLHGLRVKMGVVLQEPFFFAATIRENLLYGMSKESTGTLKEVEQKMIEAAETANAHHFISRLPKGYNTELTERGMNLSQGERQLLAITRTLLSDPKILILDEATSNVDSLTERKIQKAVHQLMKGRTSIVIAHRLSTIKRADNLLVLHNKTIIEQGTHQQLMENGGFYSTLYSLQFEKAEITEEQFE
jgi:ATP-binding cassette, subfamily B, multidrug efflux pump